MIIAVKLVFAAATLAYLVGFVNRTRNNALHRRMMVLGFLLTLGIAGVLLVGVYGFHASYGPAGWLLALTGGARPAQWVLLAHRAVATLTLLVLITQILAGVRRHPLHRRLYRAVVPLWVVTLVSGLVLFV
jgi:uncharacterized membrane protein YozB (DUF420 family)